jgi:molybdate transport system regulatory protein
MNKINVTIKEVKCSGGVILVEMVAEDCPVSALLIDSTVNPNWLKKGNNIFAIFKETEVSIAKDFSGKISLRNKLPCIVKNIKRGQLIGIVSMQFLQYTINAAITSGSIDMLDLKIGEEVTALIKANEITLMQK